MSDLSVQLRIPPHSPEAEDAVIGCLLMDNDALHQVPHLTAEAFFRQTHREAFTAIQGFASKGQSWDVLTVFERMKATGCEIDLPELTVLTAQVSSAKSVRRYADIVVQKSQLRQLLTAGYEISDMALEDADPASLIDRAQMKLAKLATIRRRQDPQHITQSLANYLQLLQEMSEGKNPAMPTGLGRFDRLLNGGLRRGGVLVIGARPKHGKTALALAIARNMARRNEVLYISQEMPISELMHRHTAAIGSIDFGRIMAADAQDREFWNAVTHAAERLSELHLTHDEQAAQSLLDVRRKAMQVKRQRGLDVLVVDFLQLMQGGNEESRNRELDVIANGVKQLAMDLDCASILLSQLTREADKSYQRPVMTYLRDSGAIEAAADVIALLHTDHAHPMSKKLPQFEEFSELEVVAQRNGPKGIVPLRFIGRLQQFGDWDGPIPQKPETKRGGDL